MTLPEITDRILQALRNGELDGLPALLEMRAQAIHSATPQELADAYATGELASQALRDLKRRSREETLRLTQVQRGIVAGFGSDDDVHINFRG